MPIDYSLPRVTLPGLNPVSCREKWQEEYQEWLQEPEYSPNKLIEAFDVLHACQTWLTNGGGSEAAMCYCRAKEVIRSYYGQGRNVEAAREAVIEKNRVRGYYD